VRPEQGNPYLLSALARGTSLHKSDNSLVGADGSVSVPAGSEIRRDPPYFCPWVGVHIYVSDINRQMTVIS